MKIATAIAGWISLSLIIVGSLFKIQHWPGASLLLILGTMLFSTVFSLLLLTDKLIKEKKALTWFQTLALCGTLSIFSVGLLFKVQHWPGASFMLLFALFGAGVVALPLFVISYVKHREKRTRFNLLGFGIGIAALSMLVSIGPSKEVLEGAAINNDMVEKSNGQLASSNDIMVQLLEQVPEKAERARTIRDQSRQMTERIEQYKVTLIAYANGWIASYDFDTPPPELDSINLRMGKVFDNYDVPTEVLIGSDAAFPKSEDEYWSALGLKQELSEYQTELMETCTTAQGRERVTSALALGPVPNMTGGADWSWEIVLFDHVPLAIAVHNLSSLQSGVLACEGAALHDLLQGPVSAQE